MTKPNAEAQHILAMLAEAASAAPPASPLTDAHDVVRAWRARIALFAGLLRQGGVALFDVSDLSFSQQGRSIGLRIYRPAAGVLPAILFLHGGGFSTASIDDSDVAVRRLALETGWAIVAVEYRLSPEHPYPAGLEDCYAALCHIAAEAGALGLDPSHIVVAGESAGGQLAAATALMARDRSGPALAGMIGFCPNTDLRENSGYPSRTTHDGKIFSVGEFERLMTLYLPNVDRTLPYVSPALARDLTRLPPSLVIASECDPLFDEDVLFGERLREAGVSADTIRLEGALHGVLSMAPQVPETARTMFAAVTSFLKKLS
jgi:acetyl esterase